MKTKSSIALFVVSTLLALPMTASARDAGGFEYTIGVAQSFSDSIVGREGSTLSLSSRSGLQIGVDYLLTSQLSVGFDMTWVRPRYAATLVPEDGSAPVDVSYRANIFSGQFNGAYSFIDGPITPYVEAGLGWTHFDSNVSDSAPIVGCWWDPWWGYICDAFYSTYSSTSFSYGAAAGLRWDLDRNLFLKAGYRWLEVESNKVVSKPVLEQASLEIGWRF
jgi:opacity protein-like surface antigen